MIHIPKPKSPAPLTRQKHHKSSSALGTPRPHTLNPNLFQQQEVEWLQRDSLGPDRGGEWCNLTGQYYANDYQRG